MQGKKFKKGTYKLKRNLKDINQMSMSCFRSYENQGNLNTKFFFNKV